MARRVRLFFAIIAVTVGAMTLASLPISPTYAAADTLKVSSKPDRTGALVLSSQSLSGNVYIFLATSASYKEVRFYIDDSAKTRKPYQIERVAPYDLAGGTVKTANPLDLSKIPSGTHTVTAVGVVKSGATTEATATFSSGAPSPTPEPSPTPTPEPSPTPEPTCTGVRVASPASIQTAIDANPGHTTFCLSGQFDIAKSIKPKAGNKFIGPATLRGTCPLDPNDNFNCFGIEGHGIANLTVENLEVLNFEIGVRVGPDGIVRGNYVHNNKRVGIGCGECPRALIEGNRLEYNGDIAWLGHSSSAMKFAGNSDGVITRSNYVYRSIGNGIWYDVQADDGLIENNMVIGSTRKGIFYEISTGGSILGNTVLESNCSSKHWVADPNCPIDGGRFGPQGSGAPGGGIAANSSKELIIDGNTLAGNQVAGINFRDDTRLFDAPFAVNVRNNSLGQDTLLRCGEWGITCSNNA